MTQWLLANMQDTYEMIVVFSNTGKEKKETLDFVKKCDEFFSLKTIWIEPVTSDKWGEGMRAKIVDYESADLTGAPFESMIAKYGIPNVTRPFCSEYMKKLTIRNFATSIGWKHYFTAIGIRIDEVDRISEHRKKERLLYPLIQLIPTRKEQVNKFWEGMPFDLELKSYEGNCDLCWKKSLRKQLTIIKNDPAIVNWWDRIEEKYGDFIPPKSKINGYIKTPLHFYREDKSVKELLELSKHSFQEAKDESKNTIYYEQLQLFGLDLDSSNGCEEACEAF